MIYIEMDKTGFPLVANSEDQQFYHFFPVTRMQFEEAIASGWLLEDKNLNIDKKNFHDFLSRGEIFTPQFLEVNRNTSEDNMPVDIILFPGGYNAVTQLVRKKLNDIHENKLYAYYLTNLKQEEFSSLVQWLGDDKFTGCMPVHDENYNQFLKFPTKHIIEKILTQINRLNPRAQKLLESFLEHMDIDNGIPGHIFEMTRNYTKRGSEEIFEVNRSERMPGVDNKDGFQLYYPIITGKSQLWPYIHVPGEVRHMKTEYHPLVGTRGVFMRRQQ